MKRKNSTFIHNLAIVLTFAALLGIFTGISIGLMVVGILLATQAFFSIGWWASLLIMFALTVIYATALSIGIETLRGKK